jgi:16S rRNA (guanine527-N7)-methyltransferase
MAGMAIDSHSGSLVPPIRGAEDFATAFNVSRETIARLETYAGLLRQWQKAVNLVAPSTLDAIWERHFGDSAQLATLAPGTRTWVDLGSGAGFPGLVVGLLLAQRTSPRPLPERPESAQRAAPPRITLIESNARKCAFMREVVRQTGVQPGITVDILSTRIESAATQARLHAPDVVSARALAPLDKLLALAAPLFSSRTVGLFLKGRGLTAELKSAERLWNFDAELVPSRLEQDGRIAIIRNLERRNEGMTP